MRQHDGSIKRVRHAKAPGSEEALDEFALCHREAGEVSGNELGGRDIRRLSTERGLQCGFAVLPLGIDGVRRLLNGLELLVRHASQLAERRARSWFPASTTT